MMLGCWAPRCTISGVRTTLTIDPDVAERLRLEQQARGCTFKEAVNDALRRGLARDAAAAAPRDRYVMPVLDLQPRPGINVDKIRDIVSDDDDLRFTGWR